MDGDIKLALLKKRLELLRLKKEALKKKLQIIEMKQTNYVLKEKTIPEVEFLGIGGFYETREKKEKEVLPVEKTDTRPDGFTVELIETDTIASVLEEDEYKDADMNNILNKNNLKGSLFEEGINYPGFKNFLPYIEKGESKIGEALFMFFREEKNVDKTIEKFKEIVSKMDNNFMIYHNLGKPGPKDKDLKKGLLGEINSIPQNPIIPKNTPNSVLSTLIRPNVSDTDVQTAIKDSRWADINKLSGLKLDEVVEYMMKNDMPNTWTNVLREDIEGMSFGLFHFYYNTKKLYEAKRYKDAIVAIMNFFKIIQWRYFFPDKINNKSIYIFYDQGQELIPVLYLCINIHYKKVYKVEYLIVNPNTKPALERVNAGQVAYMMLFVGETFKTKTLDELCSEYDNIIKDL